MTITDTAAGLTRHDTLLASCVAGMAKGVGDVGPTLTRILNGKGPAARDARHISQVLLAHGRMVIIVDPDTRTANLRLAIPTQRAAA